MNTGENLKRNITKRGSLRSTITKLIKKIDNEILKESDLKPEIVEDCLATLLEHKVSLENLDDLIQSDIEESNLEAEIETCLEYKESIITCKSRANRFLNNLKKTSDITSEPKVTTAPISDIQLKSNTKLPRISLNKFTGDICEFQEFWPQFKVAVHENEALQEIEKFTYLKSLISGAAAAAINGLPLTGENYATAINILKDRFGKKEVLISAHTNKLLNLEAVRRSSDIYSLRKLYDEIAIQIRSLESLDVKSDQYGCLLLPIIYKCIPNDLLLQFHREQCEKKDVCVNDLLLFLKREIEAREKVVNVTSVSFEIKSHENKFKQNPSKYFIQGKSKNPSAFTLNTITENLCPFCSQKHEANLCNLNFEERKQSLSKQAKCFRCYKRFHKSKFCKNSNIRCTLCNSKAHQNSLCNKKVKERSSNENKIDLVSTEGDEIGGKQSTQYEKITVSSLCCKPDEYVYFQTLKGTMIGKDKNINVRILLDSASQRTFVGKNLSKHLNLEVTGQESLKIHTFAGTKPIVNNHNRVKIFLKDKFSDNVICLEALETEKICSDIIRAPSSELNEKIKEMGIQLSDVSNELSDGENKIDLLIGSDYYWSIMTGKYKRISPTLVLNETKLGWTLHGRFSDEVNVNNLVGAMYISIWDNNEDDKMSIQLEKFWTIEGLGIQEDNANKNLCDNQILEQFENSIEFKNNRYEVKLPMKYGNVDLPNNYDVAKKRFNSLIKRFVNNPALFKEYKEIIDEYKALGIVEIVEPQEINSPNGNLTYYLPHHPVIRRDKQTTKLRIVFDASSHAPSEPSLNDVLFPGPNLNSDLFDLILKFRSNKIAVVADIEKAFLQISLAESDRDMTRFLWIEELPQDKNSPVNFIIMKMCRVLFGVTSSPFLLGAVIKHHLKRYATLYPETCSKIDSSMYVDDLLLGAHTVNEALKISKESLAIFQQANMFLRKWQSNSTILKENLKSLDMNVCADTSADTTPFKILGLIWDTEEDIFRLDNQSLLEFVHCQDKTKRTIIRAAGRIFDPVGFLSPFTILIKMIFQSLWEHGIDWDQILPEHLEKRWDNWCAQIPYISKIKIPRYYFQELDIYDNVEIHCFSDASIKAYGSVIYLRYNNNNSIKTSFVTSKSRLAPIKKLTLPRLELMGALIAARLGKRVMSVLKISEDKVHYWSDSNIVLHWIKSSSSTWKQFVSNRTSEIQSLTDPKNWRHCPGSSNPADRLTRGLSLLDLEKDDLWWSGPPWLVKDSKFWPKEDKEIDEDMKQLEAKRNVILQNICSSEDQKSLIEIERFSSFLKAVRTLARVRRFIFNLKNPIKRKDTLSAEELKEAEELLIKEVQMKNYKEEIELLEKGNSVKKTSRIYSLCPYLDENKILRIKTRLNEGSFDSNETNPIILPKNEKLTELLIMQEHRKLLHSGVSLTLAQIQKKFWIPQGRQSVRKNLRKCLICRRYNAKAADQLTGQLPKERISQSPAFTVIGLDFAGPIIIKTDSKETSKSYIVLFTCAATRAIHLEAARDMTTKSFMMCFRRFISRRGNCKIIFSDNALSFKAADKELQQFEKIIKDQKLQDFIANKGILWKFIIERAPWWGGFYERLVKSVKEPLRKILGRALITFEELVTILTEIEAVINMRPLTYTTSDFGEPEPLTPAHFLQLGRENISFPLHFAELENKISTRETLLRRKRYQTTLLKQLWTKWKEQYLLNLRSIHQFKTPERHKNLKIGDVVLVDGNAKSKLLWDLGVVKEVILGRDQLIRACMVKTAHGLLRKPVQLLYPLELDFEC